MSAHPDDVEYQAAVKGLRARGFSLGEIMEVARPHMTLRDWFAGNDTSFNALLNWSDEDLAQMARNRYRYADAMLAARSTEGEKL